MACCCKKAVGPLTIFEQVVAGKKFHNADMKCDYAGNKIAEMVENGEVEETQAINECLEYAHKLLEVKGKKQENHMLAWMCMHLSLGLCHKFNIKDKAIVRHIMQEILPMARGIDNGIFFRDIVAFGDDSQFLDANEKEMLQKAMYYFRMAACFKIDLSDDEYARSVYGNFMGKIPKSAYYIDLPLGNPNYALGTVAPTRNGPLMAAVEAIKPHAVLQFLRYGANPHGEPLNHVLASLSHAKTLADKTQLKASESPLGKVKQMLTFLLRSVNNLKIRIDDQRIGDMDHEEDVYFVSGNITEILEDRFYSCPNTLKQMCRTKIRQLVSDNDALPEGLYTLPHPKLITTHKRYLDLLG